MKNKKVEIGREVEKKMKRRKGRRTSMRREK
jgi:hypothetical protein